MGFNQSWIYLGRSRLVFHDECLMPVLKSFAPGILDLQRQLLQRDGSSSLGKPPRPDCLATAVPPWGNHQDRTALGRQFLLGETTKTGLPWKPGSSLGKPPRPDCLGNPLPPWGNHQDRTALETRTTHWLNFSLS